MLVYGCSCKRWFGVSGFLFMGLLLFCVNGLLFKMLVVFVSIVDSILL